MILTCSWGLTVPIKVLETARLPVSGADASTARAVSAASVSSVPAVSALPAQPPSVITAAIRTARLLIRFSFFIITPHFIYFLIPHYRHKLRTCRPWRSSLQESIPAPKCAKLMLLSNANHFQSHSNFHIIISQLKNYKISPGGRPIRPGETITVWLLCITGGCVLYCCWKNKVIGVSKTAECKKRLLWRM